MTEADANRAYVDCVNRSLRPVGESCGFSVSLFSGLHGIDIGFERAGFRTAVALDLDKDAAAVKAANQRALGEFPFLCEDITKLSPTDVMRQASLAVGEAAVVIGGPPCQPFSKSGDRTGTLDSRGMLFARYLEYLREIQPEAFLLENVRGLFSARAGADFRLIVRHFQDAGYTIYWRIVDAANYGVPQFRQRLFLVGFREQLHFEFPHETHRAQAELASVLFSDEAPFVTTSEAVADLQDTVLAPPYNGKFAHLLPEIPQGLNYSYYTAERGHPSPVFRWRSKYWYFLLKAHPNRPSLTIQAHPGNNTGPFHWDSRRFAITELRRLQSFPDWLTIDRPYFVAHRLIGNAVPPLLAEPFALSIREALAARMRLTDYEYRALRQRESGKVRSGSGAGKGKFKIGPREAA
jgi:DNA (cytosine-5)-methyltransferase 1